ncbi:hypothetical protein KBD69_01785 [Candidatus Woesebacteria bacterium]|nr:hypothetical protein [Candidatus Woesebacteria bacterium]
MSVNINREKTLPEAINEYRDTVNFTYIWMAATVATNLISNFALENNLNLKGVIAVDMLMLFVNFLNVGLLTSHRNRVKRLENAQK